mmetsp:Transcript_37012/g.87108  ORF Transcript_37012/g.87108 Transcript_37012/m.87108 type:complete len:548 (+) Transcript_37012:764-2407(+)
MKKLTEGKDLASYTNYGAGGAGKGGCRAQFNRRGRDHDEDDDEHDDGGRSGYRRPREGGRNPREGERRYPSRGGSRDDRGGRSREDRYRSPSRDRGGRRERSPWRGQRGRGRGRGRERERGRSGTLRDRDGNRIKCRLCGDNHFMDPNCPFLEEARAKYGKRVREDGRGRSYNSRGRDRDHKQTDSQSRSRSRQRSETSRSSRRSSRSRSRSKTPGIYFNGASILTSAPEQENNSATMDGLITLFSILIFTGITLTTFFQTWTTLAMIIFDILALSLYLFTHLIVKIVNLVFHATRATGVDVRCKKKHLRRRRLSKRHTSNRFSIPRYRNPRYRYRLVHALPHIYCDIPTPHFAGINTLFSKSLAESQIDSSSRERKTTLKNTVTPKAFSAASTLPKLQKGEQWFVCDSGANRHYHPTDEFMYRTETSEHDIGGLTGPGCARTKSFGIFACRLEDSDGRTHELTSVSFQVRGAEIGLFSEVQACIAGNTIVHEGDPWTGKHGMYLKKSRTFIPYHWDERTHLWYIKVLPAREKHCMAAVKLDPWQGL